MPKHRSWVSGARKPLTSGPQGAIALGLGRRGTKAPVRVSKGARRPISAGSQGQSPRTGTRASSPVSGGEIQNGEGESHLPFWQASTPKVGGDVGHVHGLQSVPTVGLRVWIEFITDPANVRLIPATSAPCWSRREGAGEATIPDSGLSVASIRLLAVRLERVAVHVVFPVP